MIGNISAELCLELSPKKPESPPPLRKGKAIWAGSHFKRRCPQQAPPFPALHSCCRASTDLLQQAGVTEWLGGLWEGQCKQSSTMSILLSLHIQILKYIHPCLHTIQIVLGVNNLIAHFSVHCHMGLTILTKNPLPYRSTPNLTLCIYSTYSMGFSSWQASSNAPILARHIKVAVHILIFLLPVGESLILKLGFCRE